MWHILFGAAVVIVGINIIRNERIEVGKLIDVEGKPAKQIGSLLVAAPLIGVLLSLFTFYGYGIPIDLAFISDSTGTGIVAASVGAVLWTRRQAK